MRELIVYGICSRYAFEIKVDWKVGNIYMLLLYKYCIRKSRACKKPYISSRNI